MVGVGHNALPKRTVSYELLKLEPAAGRRLLRRDAERAEGSAVQADRRPRATGTDELFLFTNGSNPFPQQILYRRGTGGWLYVEVAGKAQGKDQKVVYPFRRYDCETGEFIRQ